MIVAMYDADDLRGVSPIVCEVNTKPGLVTLDFKDATGSAVSMHLPDHMAACVAMIAEAFNAHRTKAPLPKIGELVLGPRRPLDTSDPTPRPYMFFAEPEKVIDFPATIADHDTAAQAAVEAHTPGLAS